MYRIISFALAMLGFVLASQNSYAQNSSSLIEVGPGPEDLVIDQSQGFPRLLISSSDRRDLGIPGQILSYRQDDGMVQTLERRGEPADVKLNPHGIYLAQVKGSWMLYVISHEGDRHSVYQYEVHKDYLQFISGYWDPLIVSPNSLTVFPDGSFFVCNDAAKHGNVMEKILKMKKATIIYYDGKGQYSVAASHLGMPAGMNYREDTLFVSDATNNKIYTFRIRSGQLSERKTLCKLKGPDNIRLAGNDFLVASHEKIMKFVQHTSHPDVPSPSAIYRVDPKTGMKTLVYHNDGRLISAASVAVEWNGYLYIGQIFENMVLKTLK